MCWFRSMPTIFSFDSFSECRNTYCWKLLTALHTDSTTIYLKVSEFVIDTFWCYISSEPRSMPTIFSFDSFSECRNTYRLHLFTVYLQFRGWTVLLHIESSWFWTVFWLITEMLRTVVFHLDENFINRSARIPAATDRFLAGSVVIDQRRRSYVNRPTWKSTAYFGMKFWSETCQWSIREYGSKRGTIKMQWKCAHSKP